MTDRPLTSEEAAELRTKKVNAQRAQRSAVTKTINQLDAAIDCRETRRLRQARHTLTEKLALLTKLDAEILDLTDEHALETEVLQADDVKERLTLALIDIADALGSDQDGKDKTGYDICATGRTHSPDHGSRCDSRDSTVTP